MTIKISVIMVCRNASSTIAQSLNSYNDQQYRNKQIVIIDGGSTDDTMEIVHQHIRGDAIIVSEPDHGIYDAMNKGLALFSGDAFGFLNADDVFSDAYVLSDIAEILSRAEVSAGHVRFINNKDEKREVRIWRSTLFTPGAFGRGWAQPHPGVYCRRTVFEKTGFFDDTYRIAGDYEWLLRIYERHGFQCEILDRSVVDMCMGGVSTSGVSSLWINTTEPLRARQKWLGSGWMDYALLAKIFYKLRQMRPAAFFHASTMTSRRVKQK